MVARPANEEELQKLEAIGVLRASRFVREYAKTDKKISLDTIVQIHREIFAKAWPDIAGKYRQSSVKITDSKHLPPHHSKVPGLMMEMGRELELRLAALSLHRGLVMQIEDMSEARMHAIESILQTAAWVHHQITYVHPFWEGNGRTARLAANLILERHGLIGLSIKVERENKDRYRRALAQIDQHGDYGLLLDLIVEGIVERYSGVPLKLHK